MPFRTPVRAAWAPALILLGCQPLAAQAPGETDLAEALATVTRWQQQHPDLVQRVELGRSVQDRPLFVLRLGSAPDGAPELYVGGGIHGSERSEQDALFVGEQLLARAGEPAVAALMATRVLWLQPLINPDGVAAGQRKNAHGVDLNRNFAARWRADRRPEAHDHGGSEPFSEPETRALREFLLGRPQLRACLDLHRSAQLLVAAQRGDAGEVDAPVRDALAALRRAVGWGDPETPPPHFAGMHGLAIDWYWAELGVVAFAMENRGEAAAADDPRWRCLWHLLEHCAQYPESRAATALRHAPRLVTGRTRADRAELQRLQRPGTVLFADGFEDDASLPHWFERNGEREGRLRIVRDERLAHGGRGVLQLDAPANGGRSSGSSAVLWLGDEGHDCVHLRYWIRYADDYDQGNLNHTGGSLDGVAGTHRWAGMGTAGQRPRGDDHFSTRVEGWRDWQRLPPPGALHCYTYWMDMRRDRDGHWWGNMLMPEPAQRVVPPRGSWQCVELRVAVNTVGKDDGEPAADGELAVWLDGELYLHAQGMRWRCREQLRIKRAALMVYVHAARRDNRVCYDDVVLSTGYVGTGLLPAK